MLYVDGIRAFAMGYHIFFTNLQNPFRFPGAGEWEEKIRSLYTGILDFPAAKAAFRPEYSRHT